jgi:hypothetical protein
MKRLLLKSISAVGLCLLLALPSLGTPAQASPTLGQDSNHPAPSAAPDAKAPSKTVPAPRPNASAADITAAKSAGKVWVNTDTGIYHKGGRWYGKTKTGKFMTETEAKAAGYKASKTE